MIRLSISLGLALTASIGATSCDSTVWLDDTLPSLTGVYASGACKLNANTLDLSVVLINQGDAASANILPNSKVAKAGLQTVDELLSSESFQFNPPPIMAARLEQNNLTNMFKQFDSGSAYSETEDELLIGNPKTIELVTKSVKYEWASSDPEAEKIPLLVLLMDQSNSVLGHTRTGGQQYGSDYDHQRITFFKSLIKGLDPKFEIALLTFSDFTSDFGSDGNEVDTPTLNRDLISNALEDLKYSGKYNARTPLKQALSDAKSMIEGLEPDTYEPVVVVFTDGIEGGDNSMGAPSISDLAAFYVARHIPVHTIQLQAKQDPMGEDEEEAKRPLPVEEMSRLACQTGGDFYYIRKANEFTTNNDLLIML